MTRLDRSGPRLSGLDEFELGRRELVDVLEHARQPLAKVRRALPGADCLERLPRSEADEDSFLPHVTCEPQRAGTREPAGPGCEARPRFDERFLLAGAEFPLAGRVDLAHDTSFHWFCREGTTGAFPGCSLALGSCGLGQRSRRPVGLACALIE